MHLIRNNLRTAKESCFEPAFPFNGDIFDFFSAPPSYLMWSGVLKLAIYDMQSEYVDNDNIFMLSTQISENKILLDNFVMF